MRFLLIIDMQEDYMGEKRNKKKFPYDTKKLIDNVNHKINSYSKEYIVYIKNQFFWESPKREKSLSKEMNVVSKQIFTKRNPNAFKNNAQQLQPGERQQSGGDTEPVHA